MGGAELRALSKLLLTPLLKDFPLLSLDILAKHEE